MCIRDSHIILRGGKEPNYSAKHVAEVKEGQMCIRDSPYGSLAQLVEQLTFNQLVAGSNPARPVSYTHLDVYKRQDKKAAAAKAAAEKAAWARKP